MILIPKRSFFRRLKIYNPSSFIINSVDHLEHSFFRYEGDSKWSERSDYYDIILEERGASNFIERHYYEYPHADDVMFSLEERFHIKYCYPIPLYFCRKKKNHA